MLERTKKETAVLEITLWIALDISLSPLLTTDGLSLELLNVHPSTYTLHPISCLLKDFFLSNKPHFLCINCFSLSNQLFSLTYKYAIILLSWKIPPFDLKIFSNYSIERKNVQVLYTITVFTFSLIPLVRLNYWSPVSHFMNFYVIEVVIIVVTLITSALNVFPYVL